MDSDLVALAGLVRDRSASSSPSPTTQQTNGGAENCKAIMHSIDTLCSSMEFQISQLAQRSVAFEDSDQAISVLGKMVPLQRQLQRIQSRLTEFGHKVPTSSDAARRDGSTPSQSVSAALPSDTGTAGDHACHEQVTTPCRRVAILTYGRWTRQSTDVLERAGLVYGQGHFGCFYLVDLLEFQKEYLEKIRRPCIYHVIVEEHRASEVADLISTLPRTDRGRLQRQEVVELPVREDEEMPEQQIVVRRNSTRPSASWAASAAQRAPATSVANVPGNVQSGQPGDVPQSEGGTPSTEHDAAYGDVLHHRNGIRANEPNADTGEDEKSAPAPEHAQEDAGCNPSNGYRWDDAVWTVVGRRSF